MGAGRSRKLFNEFRVSVEYDEKMLSINNDNGYTFLMYAMPMNCTLKMLKMLNFILCTFYHNKKNSLIHRIHEIQ